MHTKPGCRSFNTSAQTGQQLAIKDSPPPPGADSAGFGRQSAHVASRLELCHLKRVFELQDMWVTSYSKAVMAHEQLPL